MKIILKISVCIIFIIAFSTALPAAERIVQLDVPGCRPCGAAKRLNTIMKKIDGIKKYENKEQSLLVITFEDNETTLNKIIDELKKGDFSIEGKPVFSK